MNVCLVVLTQVLKELFTEDVSTIPFIHLYKSQQYAVWTSCTSSYHPQQLVPQALQPPSSCNKPNSESLSIDYLHDHS